MILPANPPERRPARTPMTSERVHAGSRVLLVSPPRGLATVLRSHPVTSDCRIAQCRTASNALDSIREGGVHALIYRFPSRAQACALLDRLAGLQSDVCVILLGQDLGADEASRLLQCGAFDYLTLPLNTDRMIEAIRQGLRNRDAFIDVRNLSSDLAKTNEVLARERNLLKQWNGSLAALNRLTQALAGSLEVEAVIRTLFERLPSVVPAELLGVMRTHPDRVWTWSHSSAGRAPESRLRSDLYGRDEDRKQTAAGNASSRRLHLVPSPGRGSRSVAPALFQTGKMDHYVGIDIPLAIGPQALGVLHVARREPQAFTEQEQQLLATVGASLALTLRNADTHQQMHELALRDPLTEVLNRRALDGPLTRELKAGLRYGTPACLLLLDLDYFKTVNDLLGHVAGDDVLKRVAALLGATVRDVDSVGRYGGEEFAVVLPHTDLDQAQALAERMRGAIERHAFELEDGHVRITASIGLASLHDSAIATVGDWISAADSALYEAKSQGRNRVVTHTPGNLAPAQAAALCVAA